jgi:RNA-directed DNA polymerase
MRAALEARRSGAAAHNGLRPPHPGWARRPGLTLLDGCCKRRCKSGVSSKGRRGYFTGFSPAISGKAKKAKGKQIRDWHLNRRSSEDLSSLAKEINPQVQGWINYYGAFYRSELCFLAWRINEHLARWAMHKFKRFRGKYAKAMAWLQKVYQYKPGLFAHWQLIAFT